eukprot:337482-Chlamydomonas_euryale.AAC.6
MVAARPYLHGCTLAVFSWLHAGCGSGCSSDRCGCSGGTARSGLHVTTSCLLRFWVHWQAPYPMPHTPHPTPCGRCPRRPDAARPAPPATSALLPLTAPAAEATEGTADRRGGRPPMPTADRECDGAALLRPCPHQRRRHRHQPICWRLAGPHVQTAADGLLPAVTAGPWPRVCRRPACVVLHRCRPPWQTTLRRPHHRRHAPGAPTLLRSPRACPAAVTAAACTLPALLVTKTTAGQRMRHRRR